MELGMMMTVVSRVWWMGGRKGGWQRALDPQDPSRWTAKRRYLTFSGKWGFNFPSTEAQDAGQALLAEAMLPMT